MSRIVDGAAVLDSDAAPPVAREPHSRPPWRAVLVPSEHGGWGLTLEPVLLGLLIAASPAGLGLGAAAFVSFLARTPLKIVLVDVHRQRRLARTRIAAAAVCCYLLGLAACVGTALQRAPAVTWVPLVLIAPLLATELWYDMRSRGRRLIPEIAGAIGIAGVVSMIVLADGQPPTLAIACWVILSARAVTSIVNVRYLVQLIHGRPPRLATVWIGDAFALVLAGVAAVIDRQTVAGAVAIVALVAVQRLLRLLPTPRASVLGATHTVLGLAIVVATASGVHM